MIKGHEKTKSLERSARTIPVVKLEEEGGDLMIPAVYADRR